MNSLAHLSALSDEALLARIYDLARTERLTTVDQVCNFAEMSRRKLDTELAFSVFTFCHEELRMPESTAFRYHRSAELVLRFPVAVEYLRDGRLNPSTLNKLHDVLTDKNHVELFNRASGLSQKQTDLLVAELKPRPDVRETVTFVPDRTPKPIERPIFIDRTANPSAPSLDLGIRTSPPPSAGEATRPPSAESIPSGFAGPGSVLADLFFRPSISIEPLRPGHFVVRINCDQQMLDDIDEARFALSHLMPKANKAEIIHECVRRTLQSLARKQRGALNPRQSQKQKKPSKKGTAAETQPAAATSAAAVTAASTQPAASTSAAAVTVVSTQPAASTSAAAVTAASTQPAASTSAAAVTAASTPPAASTSAAAVSAASTHPAASTSAAEVTAASTHPAASTSAAAVTVASTQPAGSTFAAEVTALPMVCGNTSADRTTSSTTSLGGFNLEPGGAQYVPEHLRGPRDLPTEAKRAVAERDQNRCAYVGPTGHRCNSRYKITFDHSLAYAHGGEPTVENSRQLCERHNKHTAVRTFGQKVMGKYFRSS